MFTQEQQSEKFKESSVMSRFGALWINYLWIEEPSNDPGQCIAFSSIFSFVFESEVCTIFITAGLFHSDIIYKILLRLLLVIN